MQTALLLCAALTLQAQSPAEKAVAALLDDWHLAAAQADEGRYFGHLAENAVFLGTDATERWPKAAFQTWAHPIFQRGKAWSFKAVRRAISFSKDGHTAWFDEDLDTPNLGPSRGSGVLTLEKDRWRIQQYNLSVPIPNALMKSVKAQIEAQAKKP
ncbi:nuclear transport factor 2 family protein [Geothrix sp. PMB-07]|uniref:nuclear transport factor 2 family protein n=1 Tax=Geothrix sp. PMB-07 TaxID=3068640 RepID=UPI0027418A9C|nr:nuclear transport factor 2 family protein [Geothrix sp. PMB-07]WLT30496.1 nuclear transport factor 2 family protein [Geothrix sp. PMB-07]